jgi:glycosyltransferase involved in cell wall biosynthesis
MASGVSVFRYPLAENYKKPWIKPLKRAVIPLLRYSLWVRKMARAGKYDLMLFNQWPLAHIVLAKRECRTKTVLDWCEVRNGWLDRIFMRWLPKLSKRNIAVSETVASAVATMSGRHVECIPSGVWLSKYRCESREQRSGLVYLGRVTEHKNLELLIEAFELMKDAGYPGDLTIAGAGPALEALTMAAKCSRFSKNVHLLGFVDDSTKIALLARSEALVISSRREGFPRIVAEAMASGLPVTTVDFSENGTKTIVQDYGIGMVSHPTAPAFSMAIADVLHNWDAHSARCLRHSRELDWSILIDKLLTSKMDSTDGFSVPSEPGISGRVCDVQTPNTASSLG